MSNSKVLNHLKILNSGVLLLCVSFVLTACGGDSSSDPIINSTNNSQPQRLSSKDMSNVVILARESYPAPVVTSDDKSITLTHSGSSVTDDLHYQFFLNVDNDASTGFNFDNEIWDEAGTDYIIQDGILFESTADDSSWSWNASSGDVDYQTTNSSVSVTIDQSLLNGLAPQIRIGFIIRDKNWDVVSIWPGASLMALASLDVIPPTDTVAPVISLNGEQNITLQLGGVFTDLGATAVDNFDGDISNKIVASSNLDTSQIGTYQILYSVSDLAGNTSTETRTIVVTEDSTNSIVIDGDVSDWSEIPVLSSSAVGSIKVTDSIKNLYILIEGFQPLGENTQIFIDSDNTTFNGFRFSDGVWSEGGADYMVENNYLSSSAESSTAWAWNYDISPISYIKANNIIEVAIPKEAMKAKRNLEPIINVGFVNRDSDWNVQSVLPENGMKEHKLTAINKLDLIPGVCGKIWETDGTAENTQESFLNTYSGTWGDFWEKHNNLWYGFRYIENSGGNDISFERYDGTFHNIQELPFSVVRSEPINNGRVTSMKFVGDTLYFIFENELWRTTASVSGSYRIKTFAESSKSFKFFTTSDELYIREKTIGSLAKYTLWKLNNQEFLTEVASYDDDDGYISLGNFNDEDGFSVLSTYDNKLYTSKKTNSGMYVVVENDSGVETELAQKFINRPKLSSTNGALYITDIEPNETAYFWRLNPISNSFEKVTKNSLGLIGSVRSRYENPSLVQGNQFVFQQYQAFINAPIARLFRVLETGQKELIDKARSMSSHYIDGNLYIDAYNNTRIGTSSQFTVGEHTLSVVNDASGNLKTLATCEPVE